MMVKHLNPVNCSLTSLRIILRHKKQFFHPCSVKLLINSAPQMRLLQGTLCGTQSTLHTCPRSKHQWYCKHPWAKLYNTQLVRVCNSQESYNTHCSAIIYLKRWIENINMSLPHSEIQQISTSMLSAEVLWKYIKPFDQWITTQGTHIIILAISCCKQMPIFGTW